jgi:hypothetical protein
MRGKRLTVIVNVVVLSLIGGAVAMGSIPASNGTISGCFGKSSQLLRVIDAPKEKCRSTEHAISWQNTGPPGLAGAVGVQGPIGEPGAPGSDGAQGETGLQGLTGAKGDTGSQGSAGAVGEAGPAGPQGATGSPGAQGSPGVLSFYTNRSSIPVNVPPNTRRFQSILCSAGDQATGGGFELFSSELVVNFSDSTLDGKGWDIEVTNPGSIDARFLSFVRCADLG